MTDYEAYDAYPDDRHWYDKLYVANVFGYFAGTERIPRHGAYVVRPVINLDGGGRGARVGYYPKGERIDPELFWCEVFYGPHVTIDYTRINGQWVQGHTFQGFSNYRDLSKFSFWKRIDYPYQLPKELHNVSSDHINLEMIGGKIIEVHLRHNTDPVSHDLFVPIWSTTQAPPPAPNINWTRIPDTVDHEGRLGFYVPSTT